MPGAALADPPEQTFRLAPPRPTHAFAAVTPAYSDWGWRPYRAKFFVDMHQAATSAKNGKGVVVALPIIADYRETKP